LKRIFYYEYIFIIHYIYYSIYSWILYNEYILSENEYILGYEIMNEPWCGNTYEEPELLIPGIPS